MKLGKVIREFEVEFDEELIPPLADVPSLPAPSADPQTPGPVPV